MKNQLDDVLREQYGRDVRWNVFNNLRRYIGYEVIRSIEYAGRPRCKRSEGKATLPGGKQVFRQYDWDGRIAADSLGLDGERNDGTPLLRPVMIGGSRLAAPTLGESRIHATRELSTLPDSMQALAPVMPMQAAISPALAALAAQENARLDAHARQQAA